VEVLSMINEFNEEVVCIGSGNTAQHVIVATSTNIYASGRNDYGQCGLGPDVRSVQGVVG
jgi:alpha-tubulin suppressor-like RCC1 family protein